jgi:hypothetical protein
MSRRVVSSGGRLLPSSLYNDPLSIPPGACPVCGGSGVQAETIDEEKADVLVPCYHCRRYCKECRKYVRKDGHECNTPQAEV